MFHETLILKDVLESVSQLNVSENVNKHRKRGFCGGVPGKMQSACRLCLAKDCKIKSIFEYEDQKSRHNELQELIKEATGIEISQDDMVMGLCGICAGMIVTVVKFKRKCLRINGFMRNMKRSLEEVKSTSWTIPVHVELTVNEERVEGAKECSQETPSSAQMAGNGETSIPECGKKTRKFYSRKGIPTNDPGLCDICGGHFSYLRSHKLIHQEYLKYSCEACGKRFRNISNFRLHKLRHKEPRFSCHACGRGFYTKPKLESHLRIHSDERPFACQICSKRFREKKHLAVHFRIHTGEKPFACAICEARFTTSAGVAQHKKHNHR
ncbi:zinc finger protein 431-like [Phlebotomus argentipes]|uniref:zinc finger protein 431-like n=1 Tax=Phlebotomus argentipes TaxID=94469 RepID=UPI002892BAC5|nr:zinc finger protein 431-like [Phlebotomus argentipes]